jgi:hypothetical protein
MLNFEWNALRVGDKVLVHDSADSELRLLPGVVSIVESARGSNDIGIRVALGGDALRVDRPRRLAVHVDPLDPTGSCWRCDDIAAGAADARKHPVGASTP